MFPTIADVSAKCLICEIHAVKRKDSINVVSRLMTYIVTNITYKFVTSISLSEIEVAGISIPETSSSATLNWLT